MFQPDLRPLPPDFWRTIFGRDGRVAVEIGPGMGEFLVAMAANEPKTNFFAVEHSKSRVAHIDRQVRDKGIENARVLHADAKFVLHLLPDTCVDLFYIQFPDPWWKRRHHRRRLLTAEFAIELRRVLKPDGMIEFITDVPEYFERARAAFDATAGLELASTNLALITATSFSRKAMNHGARLHGCLYRRVDVPR